MKNYKLRIRNINKIGKKNPSYGEFQQLKNNTFNSFFDIKISTKKNKKLDLYFRTLIHELFHLAFHVINLVYRKQVTGQSEHKFITEMEDQILLNYYLLKWKKK